MEWEEKFDELSLGRGRNLARSEKIIDLKKSDTEISATVTGVPRYDVSVSLKNGVPIRMRCQCPKFRGRGSCEHLAAVLFAAFGSGKAEGTEQKETGKPAAGGRRRKTRGSSDSAPAAGQENAEETEALRKKEAIVAAARAAAEKEAATRKAEEEEKARQEQQRREVAEQIARREAEKKAKRAERKQKRREAEEAQRRAKEEEERLRREEEQKRQEEEAKKAAQQAAQRAREEEQRRKAQEEAARRREERVQAAIARKEQQEEEKRQEAKRQDGGKPASEADDGYRYFDFPQIRKELHLSSESIKRGETLLQREAISQMELFTGYADSRDGMVVDVNAVGKERKKEFRVRLVFERDDVMYVDCGCPECANRFMLWQRGYRDCEWVSALLDLTESYIEHHGIGDATDKMADWVLHTFHKRRASQVIAQTEAQDESLCLVPRLQQQGDELRLSFKVGSGKLFVVKDLFEFCSHVKKSETATYGSSTQINHRLENFTQEGRKWYAFLNKVVQEEERLEQRMEEEMRYSYRGSRLNALELYGWRLDQFYDLLGENTVEYEHRIGSGKEKSILTCRKANPEIVMHIRKSRIGNSKTFHGIEVSCRMPEFFYGVDSFYFIEKGGLCRAQAGFMEPIRTLVDASQGGQLDFRVGRRQLPEFYYSVLPMLRESLRIEEEDAEGIHAFLPPEVSFVFYLDAGEENMTCRAHAVYGDREVSVLDLLQDSEEWVPEPFRMENREREILYRATQLFPVTDASQDILHCGGDEELMYQVLEHGVDELAQLGEVQCTRRFRNMNVIRRMKMSVGVSVSEGLLNLDIGTEDISRQELLDILKSYRSRRKYYRLKSGAFLNLQDNSLELLSELMQTLQLSPKEFVKGKMHIPAYRALYMDKLLEENENIYNTRDSYFKKMVQNFKTISDADFEEPQSLSRVLRGYQKNGFKWLKTLEAYGFGGILADDMGLGKTLQMIAVLLDAKLGGRQGTSLIVCPASLVYNWEEELHRFAPQLQVAAIAGSQEVRYEKLSHSEAYDVLVTSYDLLKRDIDRYEDKNFLYEVIDEAQYIKNHTTAAAKAVKVIRGAHRFALTGTPIENRLSELWSIFDYLMPGFLYGYDVFKREMETPIVKNGDEAVLKRLQRMTGPFILRRLKQDVLKDLPDKLEEVRYVQLEEAQRRAYDAQVVHMQELLAAQSGEDFSRNKMQVLAELTRLRQICCDPSLCFENYKGESAKLEACVDLVASAIDGGHKLLLFSQFTSMLELLQKRLDEQKIPYYTITGATDKEKRLQMVKAFNADDTPVFLISLKAGGVGLNLTGADVVIHYDPWWNLAAQEQATDRAHRIGQTKKVTVYKLIARQTVEEKILALQESKRDLADSIVNAQAGQLAGMSKEELLALLEA